MKLIIYTRGNIEDGDMPIIMNTYEEIKMFYTTWEQDLYCFLHIMKLDGQSYEIDFDPTIDSIMIVE